MKKGYVAFLVVASAGLIVSAVFAQHASASGSGEAMFKQNCAVCHPDGGNIINPQKTLKKKDREANNVKSKSAIVKLMRNPGPGMTKFDESTISNHDAEEIAEYILKTFK